MSDQYERIFALCDNLGVVVFERDIDPAELARPWTPWRAVGAVRLQAGLFEVELPPWAPVSQLNTEAGFRSPLDLLVGDDAGAEVIYSWQGQLPAEAEAAAEDAPAQPR